MDDTQKLLAELFAALEQPPQREQADTAGIDTDALFADLNFVVPSAGRPVTGEAKTPAERKRAERQRKARARADRIAVIDFETDPFDNGARSEVYPFLAVLYSDQFEPIVIWEDDYKKFTAKVVAQIEALSDAYTIYAHNGGKFDYMFLMRHLRGEVQFKGRGIMRARIGAHELRDSFHIIPDKLANYKKDHIDYAQMARGKRRKHKSKIIEYCIADCRYLFSIVQAFVRGFGFKISIGQAAIAKLQQSYKFETIGSLTDEYLRTYFFGGRVECLQGQGDFRGDYKLYDVNSMYPYVMAHYQHPIGRDYIRRSGAPGEHTIFIDLECYSRGAFVRRATDGSTEVVYGHGRFKTSIWEYHVARRHGLLRDVRFHECVDCVKRTDFRDFVLPMYNERLRFKPLLASMRNAGQTNTREYDELVKDDMFYKFLLNNAYGKFAQNPRKYKEHYLTDPGAKPELEPQSWGPVPKHVCGEYWIWERPNPNFRFKNVGTGASITGAARSVLLDAICKSKGAIYCDTDSLVCLDLPDVPLHASSLGAWDIEKRGSRVIINGKKLYAFEDDKGERKVKAKGAASLSWNDMEKLLVPDAYVISTAKGVTLTKTGEQYYMERTVRATAKPKGDENAYHQR